MDEKPWWRDPRALPPSTKLDRYFEGVKPQGLVFAGVLLVAFGLLATFFPDTVPITMTAFGGALIGQVVMFLRKERRQAISGP